MSILITGVSRGIGAELARQYLEDGETVWGVSRSATTPALAALKALGGERFQTLTADVRKPPAESAFQNILGDRKIRILIHNAGVFGPVHQDLSTMDREALLDTFETNVIAPLLWTQQLLHRLDRPCRVVLMTSKMGSIADNTSGGYYAYRASKTALNMVGQSLARDLQGRDAAVLLMHPGWVQTDMGGANALITVKESVTGMRRVIAGMKAEQSGVFLDYQGRSIPW